VAGLLCYSLGIITGILFLVIETRSRTVRFHAVQSTVVFGALAVLELVGGVIPLVGGFLRIVIGPLALILWVLLMVKAYQGELYKLPIAGDIAEEHCTPRGV
jgi:uncharacterized membrane protein